MNSTKLIILCLTLLAARIWASTNQTEVSYFENLESNDPNYFVIATPLNNGELNDDNMHAEFYLSIKYPFLLPENTAPLQPDRLDLIHNSLYDFYLLENERYDSSPIISRRQNPGINLRWDFEGNREFALGYFHESNGQTLNREDGSEAYYEEVEQGGTEYALTQVSRGWEYFSFCYKQSGGETYPWSSHLEYRQFMTRQGAGLSDTEDQIFWDPDDDSQIQDYDGLRFVYEHAIPAIKGAGTSSLRLELKTGTSSANALGHFGGKISYTFCNWLHFFYFNGYGKEPSTYHLRTEYAGFGLVFR